MPSPTYRKLVRAGRQFPGIAEITLTLHRDPPVGAAVLNDALPGEAFPLADTPGRIAECVAPMVGDWEAEQAFAVLLSTRRRILAVHRLSRGTVNTLFVVPSDVFRAAIVANAPAVVVVHTHPSGDPSPSEGDIRCTRELIRAGQVLKIELLDHVIIPNPALRTGSAYASLRELGHFYL